MAVVLADVVASAWSDMYDPNNLPMKFMLSADILYHSILR